MGETTPPRSTPQPVPAAHSLLLSGNAETSADHDHGSPIAWKVTLDTGQGWHSRLGEQGC